MTNLIRQYGAAHQLLCPQCGWDCVHITHVTVTARIEDQTATIVRIATTERDNITISADTNPPGRRDNTVLQVWCEECGGITDVRFLQHKGATKITCEPAP